MSNAHGGRRRKASVPDLVSGALDGNPVALARLLSLVENGAPGLREAMSLLAPHAGRAHVVGITGAPGVGKSTSTNALVSELRSRGRRVAVLAVDPSSPFSGGALLGDRIRMEDHATDAGVFLRSMASRGHLGGLSWAAPQALRVLDAAGFDVVLVETVGVGQSEVEIAGLADTCVVLLAPGLGDGIQAAKAGILEIGDLYVVNKADREGADTVRRELRSMFSLSGSSQEGWRRPVLKAVARTGQGVAEWADALEAHLEHSRESGTLDVRRRRRARREVEQIATEMLRARWSLAGGGEALESLAVEIVAGRSDPWSAADLLVGHS
ncbi:methylmalonyl Co-A mutase-associated GTPase MeaB, partial [Nocardioides yefusunii]